MVCPRSSVLHCDLHTTLPYPTYTSWIFYIGSNISVAQSASKLERKGKTWNLEETKLYHKALTSLLAFSPDLINFHCQQEASWAPPAHPSCFLFASLHDFMTPFFFFFFFPWWGLVRVPLWDTVSPPGKWSLSSLSTIETQEFCFILFCLGERSLDFHYQGCSPTPSNLSPSPLPSLTQHPATALVQLPPSLSSGL